MMPPRTILFETVTFPQSGLSLLYFLQGTQQHFLIYCITDFFVSLSPPKYAPSEGKCLPISFNAASLHYNVSLVCNRCSIHLLNEYVTKRLLFSPIADIQSVIGIIALLL